MTAAALRRLPGFAFEARASVYDEVLPRMDVAVFAGFAASGPMNLPVPVEDVAQFAAVFGADAPLAWDADLGRTVYAQLAPAVRMFFANGGRRCWIVRLARGGRTNALPVPGVVTVAADGTLAPFALSARSPGSWSDGIALAASLASRRFGVLAWDATARALDLLGATSDELAVGDLLRLTWPAAGVQLYAGVKEATAYDLGRHGPRRNRIRVIASDQVVWFDIGRNPVVQAGTAELLSRSVAVTYVPPEATDSPPALADRVTLALDVSPQDAPPAGKVVVARLGTDELVLSVDAVALAVSSESPPLPAVRVTGTALWRRAAAPTPAGTPIVERLALDLRARITGGEVLQLAGLGLAPGHPRHVGRLPDDTLVYGQDEWPDAGKWKDAVAPRFPAAGSGAPLCIPFGVTTLPTHELPALLPAGSALERDGLAGFDAALFADEALAGSLATTLGADAEYLRFFAPASTVRALTGLHTALGIEEATLIAAPDAAQPGWEKSDKGEPLPPDALRTGDEPSCIADDFIDCGDVRGPAPTLQAQAHDADRSVQLEWTAAAVGPFILEEARSRDWRDAAPVYTGAAQTLTLNGRAPGDYYYRVRGAGERPTEWSAGVAVRIAPGGGWRVRRPDEYRDDTLMAVHRLLARFCAARRDTLAVLSLPEHYREDDAAAHVRVLGSPVAPAIPAGPRGLILPLGVGEAESLGFAALYHGWVYTRDDDGTVRTLAPDGAACGVMARRANERGAWVAPANEPLRAVIAIERPAASARWAELQQLQINVVRQTPRGFTVVCADTLAPDDEVRPINVRRLLILLRRVALRLGATYVFEPNDDSFRRMVQRGFEAMLGDLFQRGAFAGATAASAFQVVTAESLNTRQSVDQGRFIVELRVAPSRPMVFLTLQLVQTGERVAVTGG